MTDWKKHLEAQSRSGLSAAEYCRREKLICSQFLYWRSKGQTKKSGQFVPIGSKSELRFEIQVKDGLRVGVPADFDAAALRRLLEVLSA